LIPPLLANLPILNDCEIGRSVLMDAGDDAPCSLGKESNTQSERPTDGSGRPSTAAACSVLIPASVTCEVSIQECGCFRWGQPENPSGDELPSCHASELPGPFVEPNSSDVELDHSPFIASAAWEDPTDAFFDGIGFAVRGADNDPSFFVADCPPSVSEVSTNEPPEMLVVLSTINGFDRKNLTNVIGSGDFLC
jgi:hypothetical protein